MAGWRRMKSGRTWRYVSLPVLSALLTGGLAALVPATQVAASPAPQPGVTSLTGGEFVSCAIETGKGYCWGGRSLGGAAPGPGDPAAVNTGGVLAGKTLTQISASDEATCALDSGGAAYCWGEGDAGELGNGSTADASVPVAVDTGGVLAGKTLTQISAGAGTACALDDADSIYCWGINIVARRGGPAPSRFLVPAKLDTGGVLAGKTITQISVGGGDICVLDSAGTAYCWGDSAAAGTAAVSTAPAAVDTSGVLAGKTLTQIVAGDLHTCALDTVGAAYCWGDGNNGQLGNGTITSAGKPVAVTTSGALVGQRLTRIALGDQSTCALSSSGAAYCWGSNFYGQLGNGSLTDSTVPVAVDNSGVLAGRTLDRIGGGTGQICAADTANTIYCWGEDTLGELGNGTSGSVSEVPVISGPLAPTGLMATPGDINAKVSWIAPASLRGGRLLAYTATATPGGQGCTAASGTSCVISGLDNGTTYSVSVVAHTTAGDSGSSDPVSVTPSSGLEITSNPALTVPFGQAFSFSVTTTGTPAPAVTRVGQLPAGVNFVPNEDGTATILGTPRGSAAGPYPVTLTARNSSGIVAQHFVLTVNRAPVLRTTGTIRTQVGTAVEHAISTKGFPVPALTESGALPGGLSFTVTGNGTAVIRGTPAAGSGGQYDATVTATSATGAASKLIRITVRQLPVVTSATTARLAAGTAGSFRITATGFPAPKVRYSGTLPHGVTFHPATATFSGTPGAGTEGDYAIIIVARNQAGTVIQNLTLTVS
jgi:alpha-tubulin suppressor-like RCC1 family protein